MGHERRVMGHERWVAGYARRVKGLEKWVIEHDTSARDPQRRAALENLRVENKEGI